MVDPNTNQVSTENPWFIKFYAPWCGHCKRLAPTWDELASLHTSELNVGKVDCTTDEGKPLCSDYEIRGFPTVLFFPAEEGLNDRYFTYEGMRSLEDLEDFALKGSFKHSEHESIPRRLEGMEYYQRQIQLIGRELKSEVDHIFVAYGYDEAIPSPYRYLLLASLGCLPFLFISLLMCLCEENMEPQKPQKIR